MRRLCHEDGLEGKSPSAVSGHVWQSMPSISRYVYGAIAVSKRLDEVLVPNEDALFYDHMVPE